MSRYIDIDDAIEIVTKTQGMWATTLHALYDAPRIDIVRCKECKWFYSHNCLKQSGGFWRYDDFCSYGEREGE